MTDEALLYWFDKGTAALWFLLASAGVLARLRRIWVLHRVQLVEPIHPGDREYLRTITRSGYLRLLVKLVFLTGALIALFGLPLFGLWRVGIVVALACLILETSNTDRVRGQLARSEPESG